MKKLKLIGNLSLALLLTLGSCATKPTIEGEPLSTPQQDTPTASGFGGAGKRVALVLGGAGVASFATVGLLKRLFEEGIQIDLVVTTGWPTVFSLADGFSKSVHDLEWFATRMAEKDFRKMGAVDFRKDLDPTELLPQLISKSFPQALLSQSRLPVVIAATNTDLGEPDIFGSGEWKEPLLRTVSVPGMYRKFPVESAWINQITGFDVREALRRGATRVVVVSMYEDFNQWLVGTGSQEDELVRRLYAAQIRKSSQEAEKLAYLFSPIVLKRGPMDFSAKRMAILAGYREGGRIIKKLRETANSTAN